MSKSIRRRRVNYSLPSESSDLFNRMIGKPILKFKVGMRHPPADDLAKQSNTTDLHKSPYEFYGGPFLITYEAGRTVVLYDDDFLGSIVLREIEHDVDDQDFLDILESQDRLGERMKIRHTVDLTSEIKALGGVISSVSIFKLPVNYYYKPTGYDMVYECVVSFNISGANDIVFASHIKQADKAMDIRISTWERLDKNDVHKLSCIWNTSQK